ncbi:spinster family MFS transporter [Sphingomonas sp. MMS24-J13]|uniref:spinster family MFS transporter n=1 Tax=Sphingomonas sp. MMS24-J13 TaxID=3238686 RepID=UPI00384B2D71
MARDFKGTTGERGWFLAVMLAVNLFAYADRMVVGAVAQAMKVDLGLSDKQIALLNGFAFALFYSMLGLPIARAAERASRTRIIAVAVFVWSIFATLSGLAGSFVQLLLFRVGVGVGEAGFNPPVASLVSDLYRAGQRARAIAIIGLGGAIGPAMGAIGGGYIAQNGSWREAFIVIGLPGLLLAPIVWFTLREPPRGWADNAAHDATAHPGILETFGTLLRKPAFIAIMIAGAVGSFATNVVQQFTSPFLVRTFGLGLGHAGLLLGGISAGAVTIGLLGGGAIADARAKKDRRWLMWVPAIGVGLSGPLYLAALSAGELEFAVAGLFLAAVGAFTYYGTTIAAVQDMAPPRMRASASFLFGFAMILLGSGLGPVVTGALSDHFADVAFGGDFGATCPGGKAIAGSTAAIAAACRSASAIGLTRALMWSQLAIPVGVIAYLIAARTFRQDSYAPTEITA